VFNKYLFPAVFPFPSVSVLLFSWWCCSRKQTCWKLSHTQRNRGTAVTQDPTWNYKVTWDLCHSNTYDQWVCSFHEWHNYSFFPFPSYACWLYIISFLLNNIFVPLFLQGQENRESQHSSNRWESSMGQGTQMKTNGALSSLCIKIFSWQCKVWYEQWIYLRSSMQNRQT
jgi:hypothetical protein